MSRGPTPMTAPIRICTVLLLFAAACATPNTPTRTQTRPAPATAAADSVNANRVWPVRSFEHIDLWFHAFAMLTNDTAHVPYFTRGYRTQMLDLRRQRNVYTALDANRDNLAGRFATNPELTNA